MAEESDLFTNWLWIQRSGNILPNQVNSVKNILHRLTNGDLARVMYYAETELSMKALQILKDRFVDDLESFEQQTMERDHESSWH